MKYPSLLGLILLVLLTPNVILASDTVDSRLTFAFGDSNVLTSPDADANASPSIPNATPTNSQRLFFDDYEGRDTPFDNLTHFVLYMNEPGYFDGVGTEAALVMRAMILDEAGVAIKDDGSYIKLTKELGTRDFVLTAFPISANRFRLGYSYDLSWGGSSIFQDSKAAPGMRMELNSSTASFFIGAKTGLGTVNMPDETIEVDTLWGILGGGSIDLAKELRFELGGGFFHRGTINKPGLQIQEGDRVRVAPWQGFGASAQITYHVGTEIGIPIDFRLMKNDPLSSGKKMKTPTYDSGTSFVLKSEFSVLGQTVQDLDQPSTTTIQPALGGDITAQIKSGKMRLHALLVYRDLSFILFDVPSFTPFTDLPKGIRQEPEIFGKLALDYHFPAYHLTPGVSVGMSRPSNVTNTFDGEQTTQVIFDRNSRETLNPGESVELVYAAKLTTKWSISPNMSFLGDVSYSYDRNRRGRDQDAQGITTTAPLTRQDPNIVGFNLMMQAKF